MDLLVDPTADITITQKRSHEDASIALMSGNLTFRYYAVYDGHGSRNGLTENHITTALLNGYKSLEPLHYYIKENLEECVRNGAEEAAYRVAIKNAFLTFDKIAYREQCVAGSCATVLIVLQQGDTKHVYVANLGDSKTLLWSPNARSQRYVLPSAQITTDKSVLLSTQDHTPKNEVETERISRAGGSVFLNRVNGLLAVSRSFGDWTFKKNNSTKYDPVNGMVSAVPQIYSVKICPRFGSVKCMLTSDGPYEAGVTIEQLARQCDLIGGVRGTSKVIVDSVIKRTTDDTTIMVVQL